MQIYRRHVGEVRANGEKCIYTILKSLNIKLLQILFNFISLIFLYTVKQHF